MGVEGGTPCRGAVEVAGVRSQKSQAMGGVEKMTSPGLAGVEVEEGGAQSGSRGVGVQAGVGGLPAAPGLLAVELSRGSHSAC